MEEEKKETPKEKVNPLAILSYLWVLVLVPLLIEKKDEFVKFHSRQGLLLFIAELITGLISWFPIIGWLIGFLAALLWLVLSILGIINVVTGQKKPLPMIGQLADKLKI